MPAARVWRPRVGHGASIAWPMLYCMYGWLYPAVHEFNAHLHGCTGVCTLLCARLRSPFFAKEEIRFLIGLDVTSRDSVPLHAAFTVFLYPAVRMACMLFLALSNLLLPRGERVARVEWKRVYYACSSCSLLPSRPPRMQSPCGRMCTMIGLC